MAVPVIKLFDHWFSSMSFGNKTSLSHARCNGTFQASELTAKLKKTTPKVGAAIAADPSLQRAVSRVCSVRRRMIDGRMVAAGVVSRMVRVLVERGVGFQPPEANFGPRYPTGS